mmetsp:Transcript_17253/g.65817  ORF Transcript_17253/g.65817 Transcript_17253/m.65817 type:complete len:249 (+) Transcript_17253:28-774(+)
MLRRMTTFSTGGHLSHFHSPTLRPARLRAASRSARRSSVCGWRFCHTSQRHQPKRHRRCRPLGRAACSPAALRFGPDVVGHGVDLGSGENSRLVVLASESRHDSCAIGGDGGDSLLASVAVGVEGLQREGLLQASEDGISAVRMADGALRVEDLLAAEILSHSRRAERRRQSQEQRRLRELLRGGLGELPGAHNSERREERSQHSFDHGHLSNFRDGGTATGVPDLQQCRSAQQRRRRRAAAEGLRRL